jgi:hypothetical protein
MKTLFYLSSLFLLTSCANNTTTQSKNHSPSSQSRGPASVKSTPEVLWGKTITEYELDFLEEVENDPSQSY